jgi:thioredoxin reductase
MSIHNLPVAIIGAGPVGLAAAAHLIERGLTPLVFEAGEIIGANVLDWGHVRMFSPWEFTVDSASVRLLERHGWAMPPADGLPTGRELVENYLRPFAELPEVAPHIHCNARVTAVGRQDVDKMKDTGREDAPFVLQVAYSDGREAVFHARAVIDAAGTWNTPNPLGSGGMPAVGERRAADRIAYGIPDVSGAARGRYANQRVMVVGAGHSAVNALLDLVRLSETAPDTHITWVLRTTNMTKIYGGGEDDALPARGALGLRIKSAVDAGTVTIAAPFRAQRVDCTDDGVAVRGDTPDGTQTITVDEIIAATGSRPDLSPLRELRLDLDPSLESSRTLGPLIDPNLHSCGTVPPHGEAELRQPEPNFYIVGMKSYGRAPTFLLATGFEQVRSVVAYLDGDLEAARDVQLNLPETGVCNSDFDLGGNACCASVTPESAGTVALGDIVIGDIAVGAPIPIIDTNNGDNCC